MRRLSIFYSFLKAILSLFFLLLFFFSCQNEETASLYPPIDKTPYSLVLPVGFPDLAIPQDNQLTQARVQLGRRLFYEPLLSKDSSLTCASCHLQKNAFSDKRPISPGVEGKLGFRNAPTLANVGYLKLINKDGGVTKLGLQALVPIEDENEMDLPIVQAAKRLNGIPEYVDMAHRAYGRSIDAFVISRALAAFQRTFISAYSRYDAFHFQDKKNALTEQEKRGMDLFFAKKTNCFSCHSGFNFTNDAFENNGLYLEYKDLGRKRVTAQEEDWGKFRVPTLRNIALTAPYMHDGSLSTLEEVVEHYNSGGKGHIHQNELIRPLGLSQREQADLLAFLETLTDSVFVGNKAFLPLSFIR